MATGTKLHKLPIHVAHGEIPSRGPKGPHVAPKNPQLYLTGYFGRMFPELEPAKFDEKALKRLGAKMTDQSRQVDDRSKESGIPALYTYFGQFISHDISFDPNTALQKAKDHGMHVDFRTPALDLDCVYGRGPNDQPYMYTKPFGDAKANAFLTGTPLNSGHFGALDLPRNGDEPGRALIGDPRNDQNLIVSQLHVLFLRFHNRMAKTFHPAYQRLLRFEEVHRELRFHYQRIILDDFLPRLIKKEVLDAFRTGDSYDKSQIKFFVAQPDAYTFVRKDASKIDGPDAHKHDGHIEQVSFPFMPLEFSVAAYRFGHSMVRQEYRINAQGHQQSIMPVGSSSLLGFRQPNPNDGIDWGAFIDVEPRAYGKAGDNKDPNNLRRLQFAYKMGTLLANPLGNLPTIIAPDNPDSLAARDLIRGNDMELPSGQDVANAMLRKGCLKKEEILTDDRILIGAPDKNGNRTPIDEVDSSFAGRCPLWTYILAEAMQNAETVEINVTDGPATALTPKLGPVGGRIVAEVILGLLFADTESVLNYGTNWKPGAFDESSRVSLQYKLVDFIRYATGRKNHPAGI